LQRCRVTQRRRIRSASRRRSQLSASVAGKTRYRPRCARVRACVRACVRVGSKRYGVSLWVTVRA
jgi:hypothetical protein